MTQHNVNEKDLTAAKVFSDFREEKGDTEAATLAFAKTMEGFNISESETRQLITNYPGIVDLAIKGLTSR